METRWAPGAAPLGAGAAHCWVPNACSPSAQQPCSLRSLWGLSSVLSAAGVTGTTVRGPGRGYRQSSAVTGTPVRRCPRLEQQRSGRRSCGAATSVFSRNRPVLSGGRTSVRAVVWYISSGPPSLDYRKMLFETESVAFSFQRGRSWSADVAQGQDQGGVRCLQVPSDGLFLSRATPASAGRAAVVKTCRASGREVG